jgi:hypothetical protein
MKFKFFSRKSKNAAEPRVLEPVNRRSIDSNSREPVIRSGNVWAPDDVTRLALKAKADLEQRQRQDEKKKLRGNLQVTYEKLKKIDQEQKRKEGAKAHVEKLMQSAKSNEVLSTDERFRVLTIQALSKMRREGFEVLKMFSKNGKYDLENMADIFALLEDYVLRKDKFPLLPMTPNPVVDKRLARVYYELLLELNAGDPVARLDCERCGEDPDNFWNNAKEIKEKSQFKNGICMRKNYIRPVGSLLPIKMEDIWEVIDSRPFLNQTVRA